MMSNKITVAYVGGSKNKKKYKRQQKINQPFSVERLDQITYWSSIDDRLAHKNEQLSK